MGSMPLCLRFGRLMMDSTCNITKFVQPTSRLNNSLGIKIWRATDGNMHRNIMNFTSTEGRNSVKEANTTAGIKPESESQEAVGNDTCSEQDLKKQVEFLSQEVGNLTKQTLEFADKYKRALADGENMRQRFVKQVEDAKLFGIQGFCKDLLEVADTLGKATVSVPKEEITANNPHLKNLYEGLILTENELKKVFKKHGLVEVNPIDQKFNPNLHEALFEQEVEGKEPGMVITVSKVGYTLHERIIRPALVGVTKG